MNRITILSVLAVCVLATAVPSSVVAEQSVLSDYDQSVWLALAESPLQLALSVKNAFVQDTVLFGQPVEVHVSVGNVAALEAATLSPEMKSAIIAHGIDLERIFHTPLHFDSGAWSDHVRVHIGAGTNSTISTFPLALSPNRGGPQDEVGVNGLTARGFFVILPTSGLSSGTFVAWASLPLGAGMTNPDVSLHSAPIALTVKMPETDAELAWVLAEQAREQEKKGLLNEAEALYRKALQKSPGLERGPVLGEGHRMFNLHAELADLFERMGKFDDALAETSAYEKHVVNLPVKFRDEILNNTAKIRTRLELKKGTNPVPIP